MKILIVEDDVIIAEQLRSIVNALEHEVIDIVHKGEAVSQNVKANKIDLVLLDINIEGSQDGIDVASKLNWLKIPFVYITSYSDDTTLKRAKETQPYGYLLKPFSKEDIKIQIEMATARMANASKTSLPAKELIDGNIFHPLTATEYKIVADIFNGLTNEQISIKNYISINTVKTHIRHIHEKSGVKSKLELVTKYLSF